MSRDGSGTYTRVEGPYVNGNVADAGEMNNELDDIADALTDSINNAGTKAFGANQSMGGFRLTDLAAPTSANDAARKTYVDTAISGLSATYQPLDATLTALAALSWSSGNALVQFTAADTVSLTLAPSVTSITASNGAGASTAAARFTNTTDNADVVAMIIEGDRATPTASDQLAQSWYMSDSLGNQEEFGKIQLRAVTVTHGSETSRWFFYTRSSGTVAARLQIDGTKIQPVSNDGMALGEATVGWSDLFLASGAVIGFNNSNVVLTHGNSTATLEATTGGLVSKLTQVSSVSGTLVAATHRNRQLLLNGNITMPNSTMAAGDWHVLTGDGSNRTITRGSGVTMYVNGVDSATATLPARQTGGAVWETASIVRLTGPIY